MSIIDTNYDESLSQKRLRNVESIEMLELMRNTRYFDISKCYGWTNDLQSAISKLLMAGDGAIASTIASNKDKVLANIDKTLELLGEI